MPTDNNDIITSTIWVGQSLAFIQHDVFIYLMGQLAALLDKRMLICLNSPSMLCGHQNTVFNTTLVVYTILTKDTRAMTMPPPN